MLLAYTIVCERFWVPFKVNIWLVFDEYQYQLCGFVGHQPHFYLWNHVCNNDHVTYHYQEYWVTTPGIWFSIFSVWCVVFIAVTIWVCTGFLDFLTQPEDLVVGRLIDDCNYAYAREVRVVPVWIWLGCERE